jgi:hypothetical protein
VSQPPDVRQILVPPVLWEPITRLLQQAGLGVCHIPQITDDLPTYVLVPLNLPEPTVPEPKP